MDSNKQIAAGATFLICGFILIWLLTAKLGWNPAKPWPPEPDPYIELLTEEFVEVEEIPLPAPVRGEELSASALTPEDVDNPARLAPESGTHIVDAGPKEAPAKTVTTQRPSTVKEVKKEQPAKPAAAVDTKKAAEEATARRTNNQVANAFAKPNAKNNANNRDGDTGQAGRKKGVEGSAGPADSKSSRPGISKGSIGGGWNWPAYSSAIPSNEVGNVVLEIAIARDGSVAKVTQIRGTGLSDATVARCIAEVRRHRFTHPNPESASEAVARITFTFADPK